MAKQGKIWGTTEEIFNNGMVSVNVLNIKKGAFCSEHQHAQKSNLFHVLSGTIEIDQWNGVAEGDIADVTTLRAGESSVIHPGAWHRFRAVVDSVVIEIYEIKFRSEDIIRRTRGGRT